MFDQHGFKRDGKKPLTAVSSPNQLLALFLVYLLRDRNIRTIEGETIENGGSLQKFVPQWSSEAHGGDEAMLRSLNYKKTSMKQMAEECLGKAGAVNGSAGENPPAPEIQININKPEDPSGKPLIEEVNGHSEPPQWVRNDKKCSETHCEYYIQLPGGTTIKDCELDISKVF